MRLQQHHGQRLGAPTGVHNLRNKLRPVMSLYFKMFEFVVMGHGASLDHSNINKVLYKLVCACLASCICLELVGGHPDAFLP